MRAPFTVDDLATLADVSSDEVERYRSLALLDPEGDGVLDDYDVLRLRLILHYRDLGHAPEEILDAVRAGGRVLYGDLLYASGEETFTVEEASETLGMPTDEIVRLRTAVGISGMPIGPRDVDVLRMLDQMLDLGVPFEALVEAGRVFGDALRRLAETEVRLFRFHVAERLEESDLAEEERAARAHEVLELLQSTIDPIVQHVHRRLMLRAAVEDAFELLETSGSGATRGAMEATIAFVDLASFTPLAQVHGDEVAADILDRFDALVRSLVDEHGGSLVKQIGDAFMLTFSDAADAVRFALALDEATTAQEQFPAVRGGIHCGRVLYRVGDYVGNTVNLASRIAALAEANEILITKPVAGAAIEADLDVEPAGTREIRGIDEPVELYRVLRTGKRATRRERDPVCGMVLGAEASARLIHGGFEFAFCSQACLKRFLGHPSRYTRPEPAPEEKPIL